MSNVLDLRTRIRLHLAGIRPDSAGQQVLVDVIRDVLNLHSPDTRRGAEDTCAGCRITGVGAVWVEHCRTVHTIARRLGVPADEVTAP